MEKPCAWGTCNTDSRYPEGMGNIIYFITISWIQTKQSKISLCIQPQYKWRQKHSFSGCHALIKLTLMVFCALERYLWLKLANVKVLTSCTVYIRSKTHKLKSTFYCLFILNWLNVHSFNRNKVSLRQVMSLDGHLWNASQASKCSYYHFVWGNIKFSKTVH